MKSNRSIPNFITCGITSYSAFEIVSLYMIHDVSREKNDKASNMKAMHLLFSE